MSIWSMRRDMDQPASAFKSSQAGSITGSTRLGWRYGFVLKPGHIQGAPHNARGLRILHEPAYVPQCGRPMLRNRNRLPPRGEAPIKHAFAGMSAGKGLQPSTLGRNGIDFP